MGVLERWRARRLLRKFAPLTAASPEGSRVRVTGIVAVVDETVIAPLSGREVVVVRSRVQGVPYVGIRGGFTEERLKPFRVEVGGGSHVIVDGSHAVLGVPAVNLDANERKWTYMARHGLNPKLRASFAEMIVAAGDRVSVGGVLLRDVNFEPPKSERVFREQLPPGLKLVGSDEHPLVIVAHG